MEGSERMALPGLAGASRAEKLQVYQAIKAGMIAASRRSPASFNEYAIPHEQTGRAIRNAPFHREWQSFLSATRWGVIIAPVEHGKSYQISVGRILWEIGKNPDIRILLIGRNEGMASKSLRFIRQAIEHNQRFHEVFPGVSRSKRRGDPWTDTDITVTRKSYSRDPTVQARGSGSTNILSSRLDLIVYDDGLDLDNTRSQYQRDKHEDWWDTVVFSRLWDDYDAQRFGRVFMIGTPFDSDDLLHRLAKRPGWKGVRYSAVENPDDPEESWRPTWETNWPLERILERKKGMTATAFARTMLCKIMDKGSRRFRREILRHALWLGRGRSLLDRAPTVNGFPLQCFTGLDPGVGKKRTDAVSCFFTVAVDGSGRRIVVDVQSGRWSGPEMLDVGRSVVERFGSQLYVEGNAAQRWLAEFGVEMGIDALAVNTGKEKWDEKVGVETLTVLMRNGLFICPSDEDGKPEHPEMIAFIRECYDFDPSMHTGDRLMAAWIADKAVREYIRPRFNENSDHNFR